MGGAIEKMAFQPPDPAYTIKRFATDVRLKFANAGGSHSVSFMLLNRTATSGYTVLFSHGNAEDLGHGMHGFEEIAKEMNVQLACYDYCGYGLSSAVVPTEKQSYKDIEAVFGYLTNELEIPKDRIILMGRSLGSGPTTNLASKTYGLAGLCLLSPLATAASVATNCLPHGLDIFCNEAKITKVKTFPVHIVHGDKDEVVPFAHGKKLFSLVENLGAVPCTNYWVPGAGHNNIEAVAHKPYYESLRQFVQIVEDYRVNVRPTLPTEAEWREAEKEKNSSVFSSMSPSSCNS